MVIRRPLGLPGPSLGFLQQCFLGRCPGDGAQGQVTPGCGKLSLWDCTLQQDLLCGLSVTSVSMCRRGRDCGLAGAAPTPVGWVQSLPEAHRQAPQQVHPGAAGDSRIIEFVT